MNYPCTECINHFICSNYGGVCWKYKLFWLLRKWRRKV